MATRRSPTTTNPHGAPRAPPSFTKSSHLIFSLHISSRLCYAGHKLKRGAMHAGAQHLSRAVAACPAQCWVGAATAWTDGRADREHDWSVGTWGIDPYQY